MLVDSSGSKKNSKNNKKRKIAKQKGGVAKKKAKRLPQRVLASIVVEKAIGREIARLTWSRRRRWHMMHHHL